VASLKATLLHWLPNVKSVHRVEALARGSGFSTYAALLARAGRDSFTVRPDATAFQQYLALHGFEVDGNILHRAFAAAAIATVMQDFPRLASHGFGSGQPRLLSDGRRETRAAREEKFLKDREEMLGERFATSFLIAHDFVLELRHMKTIRAGSDSYRLKHIAENRPCTYPNGAELGPDYVFNGALIAAAIHNGFQCKFGFDSLGYEHPNANFNMSKSQIEDFDAIFRPNGAVAQAREARAWEKQRWRLRQKLYAEGI
jgi:hypothetical protein